MNTSLFKATSCGTYSLVPWPLIVTFSRLVQLVNGNNELNRLLDQLLQLRQFVRRSKASDPFFAKNAGMQNVAAVNLNVHMPPPVARSLRQLLIRVPHGVQMQQLLQPWRRRRRGTIGNPSKSGTSESGRRCSVSK